MADVQAKPMPVPDAYSRPYWDGANQDEFRFQRCRSCGKAQFYSRYACVFCHSTELQWQVAAGGGQVASFSVIHRAPLASFIADTPYVLALVDLDEGFRFMCNVLNCDPAKVHIGLRVRVCFESRPGSEQKIPQVEPATP
ncbi:MAG: OB-fold domain-containing protein [Burkholderiaceae bacterium]|nr:OB-fold domain-containing protein [Burkholderiaceae bacterium]